MEMEYACNKIVLTFFCLFLQLETHKKLAALCVCMCVFESAPITYVKVCMLKGYYVNYLVLLEIRLKICYLFPQYSISLLF